MIIRILLRLEKFWMSQKFTRRRLCEGNGRGRECRGSVEGTDSIEWLHRASTQTWAQTRFNSQSAKRKTLSGMFYIKMRCRCFSTFFVAHNRCPTEIRVSPWRLGFLHKMGAASISQLPQDAMVGKRRIHFVGMVEKILKHLGSSIR